MDNTILDSIIHDTSIIYHDAYVRNCDIGNICLIADRVTILNTKFMGYNQIGKDCYIQNSYIDVGSYLGYNVSRTQETCVGKYCNISWQISIGGRKHLYLAAFEYGEY